MKMYHSSSLEGGGIPEMERPVIPEARAEELHLNFFRHFDPTPGQWLSEDHAAFADDGQNLRPYVGTNDRVPSSEGAEESGAVVVGLPRAVRNAG